MTEISPRRLAILAGAGSAGMLVAALGFQAIGYAPCELCILQRWPHLAAALIAALLIWRDHAALRWLGAAAAAIAFALAAHHSGVELGWWPGPTACSGAIGDLATMSTADLMARLQAAPVVRCDQPSWHFLGLTMAAWNAICSAVLTLLWLRAATGRGIRL
ncbi:MAG: disulfide bond formation protein B [Paracoccus sp. (in: a-proteobacteria)]|nr:disulfide bond formation protein B [Paracoccus sp. (in: a-proteobacteria)]